MRRDGELEKSGGEEGELRRGREGGMGVKEQEFAQHCRAV